MRKKKVIIALVCLFSVFVVGCGQKEDNNVKQEEEKKVETKDEQKEVSSEDSNVKVQKEIRVSYINPDSGETETEVKNGKEKEIVHKTFPGYVLVEMIMSDASWYVVRNTPGVTGFVGSHGAGSKPAPLLPEEVNHILRSIGMSLRQNDLEIEVGEVVKIIEGAFAGLEGQVTEVDEEKEKLKVNIDMFGRETSTELDFDQVDKID